MDFDSEEWRAERDRKLSEWIGDPHAEAWFLNYCEVCEIVDDFYDADVSLERPKRQDMVARLLNAALIEMPISSFFQKWKEGLVPLIIAGVNAWLDANEAEAKVQDPNRPWGGDMTALQHAFVLREQYMEVLAFIIYLKRGFP